MDEKMALIRAELDRVGVTDLGPCDSIVARLDGRKIRLSDDAESWTGSPEAAIKKLRHLEDDAGWEEFWQKFNDD